MKLAEVTCVFSDYNGKEIKRERVAIVGSAVPEARAACARELRNLFGWLSTTFRKSGIRRCRRW